MSTSALTLIGKPGCHLCGAARDVVGTVIAELSESGVAVTLDELSILDDPALAEKYAEEIPVLLLNGRIHTIWRVDPDRLKTALVEAS